MKILHVTEAFAPLGGLETYLIDLLPLLQGGGHRNLVAYRKERDPQLLCDGGTFNFGCIEKEEESEKIGGLIAKENPDVVFLHDVYNPLVVETTIKLRPAIAYMHNFYAICPGMGKYFRRGEAICTRRFGLGCVPRIYLRRCATARHPASVYRIMRDTQHQLRSYSALSKVVVASSFMKQVLEQNSICSQRIEVIPYFIPFPKPMSAQLSNSTPPQILFAGRLENEKGVHHLLRALAKISAPFRLVVAGDGTYRSRLQEQAAQLGLAEKTEFLGWLGEDDLDLAYRRSRLLTLTSIWPEPFGKVGLEAMARGKPVVAFDGGGVSDWLKDEWNGFKVSIGDEELLAQRIELLLERSDLADKLGENGRSYVRERYASEEHLQRLLKTLNEVRERGVDQ